MVIKEIILNGVAVGSYESTENNEMDMEIVQKYLENNGLHKESTLTEQIFGQANCFASVAISLYKNDLKVSPFKLQSTSPFVVNAAFAIELYLKAIHNAYGNSIRGHHLENLYKKIPDTGKLHVLDASKDVRSLYQLPDGADIDTCFESLSYAFENWRYIYEKNQLKVELQSIRYTLHVTAEACRRVCKEIENA
jgi:hypothetical protein